MAMENKGNRHNAYMALPVVLAMAVLLMVAVIAAHSVCAGVSGCPLPAEARGGLARGTDTGTYSYVTIPQ